MNFLLGAYVTISVISSTIMLYANSISKERLMNQEYDTSKMKSTNIFLSLISSVTPFFNVLIPIVAIYNFYSIVDYMEKTNYDSIIKRKYKKNMEQIQQNNLIDDSKSICEFEKRNGKLHSSTENESLSNADDLIFYDKNVGAETHDYFPVKKLLYIKPNKFKR